ncbi:MAG: MFS transporter [Alphaproteobacteria bacterium]|nr:MFS transporter [Alphaproteobacteria bacterium]
MNEVGPVGSAPSSALRALGSKLDSIPFSSYHVLVILVLGLVGFVEGYDLAVTGSLIVLAKKPLHLTPADIQWLVAGPSLFACCGGFVASAISDHLSRKTMLQIGVISVTGLTLLIPLVQSAEQLIALRILIGFGGGFAVTAPFPIAAELMPAQHRRTYSAIYEIALASSFTVLPLVAALLAENPNGFRLIALPGGLAVLILPAIVHFLLPESPRWHLRKGRITRAVDTVNHYIARCGNRVPPLTVAALGMDFSLSRSELPPFRALFRRGQLRWTVIGSWTFGCAVLGYFLISVLLPKALIDQGAAVSTSFGIATLAFMATIPGKAFTAYLMEIIGRRWTILYALLGSIPGLLLMGTAHLAGALGPVLMTVGALWTGFTMLSSFPATRMYLSEQFPTALRGRGHTFGEAFARLFAGVLAPFLMVPHTGSPAIFFGTILAAVIAGAFAPLLFGKETVGQIEVIAAEAAPEPA